MRYRVRGPLHSDIEHIATELRGFIAHTGPIRLGYLQMHGVAAHTIDVSDAGAAFFEETVLPKIGATGSFVEQRTPLRQPKELKLTATLCPTTATSLPNLSEWAGVWSEVVYGPRRTRVRLRCLPEDAPRLRELEQQGWRVLRGPAALFSSLVKAAPFAPQFWPSRAGCAAAPAPAPSAAAMLPAELPAAAPQAAVLAPATVSSLTASDVLAAPDAPNLLLGVTPAGQGVRLAWRAMIVAVQDGGQRQDAVIPAMLFRALTQGMGALVIAERSKMTPRAMAPLAKRLRVIDMADPWESARIPWRSLSPEGLKLLLGGEPPSPLPETLADTLRAIGRRNLATPVVEALTCEPAHDLAGTLEAGGGVVLLVEPGPSASLLASLLILNLSLARGTRPLLICRPASLPMPSALADRAVQIVFGDAPTAALQLHAAPDSWRVTFPDGQKLTLQENLAAPVEEQAVADHAALMNGLQGRGWTREEAVALAVSSVQFNEGANSLEWLGSLDESARGAAGLSEAEETASGGVPGLDWPKNLEDGTEADEGAIGLPEADEPPLVAGDELPALVADEAEVPIAVAADDLDWPVDLGHQLGDELPALVAEEGAVGLPEADETPLEVAAEAAEELGGSEPPEVDGIPLELDGDATMFWGVQDDVPSDEEAWPASLLDEGDVPGPMAGELSRPRPVGRRRGRLSFTSRSRPQASSSTNRVIDDSFGLSEADELPLEVAAEASAAVAADDLDWPVDLGHQLGDELPALVGEEGAVGLSEADEAPLVADDELPALMADEAEAPTAMVADDLDWPVDLDGDELSSLVAEKGAVGLLEADEVPLEVTAEAHAVVAADDLGWLADLSGDALLAPVAGEDVIGPLEADEAPTGLPEADEAPTEGIAALVTAWRAGESLTALARELRRQQPTLSLLEATQVLKAAIHGEGEEAAPLCQSASASADQVQTEHLLMVLRNLAAEEPVEPVAQDALRRWREGGQRREVVRDLAATYGMKELDARTLFDQVIFPRVISDLNGSGALVVSYLREAGSEMQGELPAPVVDCATRLLGNTSPHVGKARALLPVMRELLTMLDEGGRV
ncbi:hypothetical protein [Chloroflexus sp.]|uniref:hypothetical protein n=1 Tax=Chloroflexus sp. TaxID=1904827 RepID=UPI002ACE5F81|nr:hypothetical protein [Chloroflexus sp.]